MKYYHKNRLLKLAAFLDNVPPERFDLSFWYGRFLDGGSHVNDYEYFKNNCGTAACAIGWACTIPSFRKAGLRINPNSDYGENYYTPVYKSYREFTAVNEFFGLEIQDSQHLFFDSSYPERFRTSPKTVADRIREFVSNK